VALIAAAVKRGIMARRAIADSVTDISRSESSNDIGA